ncbi:MAG: carboxypeptidase-like regulatory domain-containing protein, partial [Pyrinomonadaceae bacterium]
MKLIRTALFLAIFTALSIGTAFAQANGSIGGTVTDANGAIIPGATVTAVAADLKQKQSISNAKGEYNITGLLPGKYTLKAIAPTFGLYENMDVVVTAGEKNEMFVILTAATVQENVDVSLNEQVSTDSDANKDATVLKGADLDALPDDPDELQAALQAL